MQRHEEFQNEGLIDFDLSNINELRESLEVKKEEYKKAITKTYNKVGWARTFEVS